MSERTSADSLLALLVEQRTRWQLGERVLVESYLAQQPALAANPEAVLDLIGNEIILRQESGEAPALTEYLQRFPQLAADLRILFEVERALEADSLPSPTERLESPATWAAPTLSTREGARLPTIPGYEILGVLSRGGQGVVYRARQEGLNRLVALKMILSGEHAGPDELARFHREAMAVARLQHANVVQIFEVGDHAGRAFFAMEYVEGGNLEQKIAATPQPPRPAAQLVETLARAMHLAHQQSIVHRDLKPANVLLTADGVPKIADFGLAKKLDEVGQTASNTRMGTPSYMAPEQARGKNKEVGPAADIYALGAIFYELLTGRPPFQGENLGDTLIQVLSDEPVPPRRLQPKVPRELEIICLKCLEKEPARRYATAQALADDLARWHSDRPILARPVGWGQRLGKWARRQPATAALAALLLLATLAVGVYLATRPSPPPDFNWDFKHGDLSGTTHHHVVYFSAAETWKREGGGYLRFKPGGDSWLQATFAAEESYLDRRRGTWELSLSHRSTPDAGKPGYSPVRVTVNGHEVWSGSPEHLLEAEPPAPFAFVADTVDMTAHVQLGDNVVLVEHSNGATTNYWLRSFRVRWVPRPTPPGS